MLRIPRSSVEYVPAPVTGPVELAELPVHMAILPVGQDPAPADWKAAAWTEDGGQAVVLIGPDTPLDLDKGTYMIWVRVTSDPEIPVMESGKLQIT
ncbi:hypothetical protein AB0C10_36380 [Microbispora amethystogenes]|uniref:hypothetical protein n=1 Tax=Microbispora amethystogenes TaxID=1427754 RepID=UPI00340738B1